MLGREQSGRSNPKSQPSVFVSDPSRRRLPTASSPRLLSASTSWPPSWARRRRTPSAVLRSTSGVPSPARSWWLPSGRPTSSRRCRTVKLSCLTQDTSHHPHDCHSSFISSAMFWDLFDWWLWWCEVWTAWRKLWFLCGLEIESSSSEVMWVLASSRHRWKTGAFTLCFIVVFMFLRGYSTAVQFHFVMLWLLRLPYGIHFSCSVYSSVTKLIKTFHLICLLIAYISTDFAPLYHHTNIQLRNL